MADGVNIDWSLAQPKTDWTQSYANAFDLGRRLAAPPAASVSQAPEPDAQAARAAAAEPGTPARDEADSRTSAVAGPHDIDIHALSEPQRQAAMQHAEAMANILQALKTIPDPVRRLDIAQHLAAQTHGAYGIDPRALTPEMVSDPAIDAYTREALGLRSQLEWAQAQTATTRDR